MHRFLVGFGISILAGGAFLGAIFVVPNFFQEPVVGQLGNVLVGAERVREIIPEKTPEELYEEALERSSNIKALYMTADVANDQGSAGTWLRNQLIEIASTTEVNGMVIDVKEVCGEDFVEKNIGALLEDLRAINVWSIARVTVFKDSSQRLVHPEWYLTRATPKVSPEECLQKKHLVAKALDGQKSDTLFWRDNRGGYWLDPAHPEAREYILDLSKRIIDLGFDELQFDYIRFPSDGDVRLATYPYWDGTTEKYEVMRSFFEYLNRNLRAYKPDIILSADLFGYAAILAGDVGIGQRLEDIGDNFDYISFMIYPSHYYSGLYLPADARRALPAVNYDVVGVRSNPDVVVGRSLMVARDYLDGNIEELFVSPTSTTTASSTEAARASVARSKARLRPWLEDFFHEQDAAAGRPSGAEKVRLQIDAADAIEGHGWLLWNAANIYTKEALKEK